MSYDGGIIKCFLFPRFIEDLTDMLGFAPSRYYYYMWKYISPLMLLALLIASIVNMGLSPPGYNAWIEEKVKCKIKKLVLFPFSFFFWLFKIWFFLKKENNYFFSIIRTNPSSYSLQLILKWKYATLEIFVFYLLYCIISIYLFIYLFWKMLLWFGVNKIYNLYLTQLWCLYTVFFNKWHSKSLLFIKPDLFILSLKNNGFMAFDSRKHSKAPGMYICRNSLNISYS